MANRYYCRFTNVIIRRTSDIRYCFVRFLAWDEQVTAAMRLNCYFVDEDDPDAPANKTELDAFPLTAGIAWDNLPAWSDGAEYQTPDLSTIFESVTDRAGWESGNAIILIVDDDGTPSTVHRKASAFEYLGHTERPALNVGWYSPWETFFDNTRWQAMQLSSPMRTLPWSSPGMALVPGPAMMPSARAMELAWMAMVARNRYKKFTRLRENSDGTRLA